MLGVSSLIHQKWKWLFECIYIQKHLQLSTNLHMPRCAAFLDVLTWLAWCLCPAWGHLAFLRALLDGRICGVPAALSAKPYAAECAAGQVCLPPYGSCWVRAFIRDKRLRTCTCLWVRETMMIESLRLELILRSSSPVVVLRDRFGGHLPFP